MILTGEVVESEELTTKKDKALTSVTILDDAGGAQQVLMMGHDHGFTRGLRVALKVTDKRNAVFASGVPSKAEIENVGGAIDQLRRITYTQDDEPLRAVA